MARKNIRMDYDEIQDLIKVEKELSVRNFLSLIHVVTAIFLLVAALLVSVITFSLFPTLVAFVVCFAAWMFIYVLTFVAFFVYLDKLEARK